MDTLRSVYTPPYEYPPLFDNLWDMIRESYTWPRMDTYHYSGVMNPYHESILALSYAWQAYQKEENDRAVEILRQERIAHERKRVGHITKRYSPQGYVAVTKPLARKLYELGHNVTLAGNNINSYHIFMGWHLGYTINMASASSTYNPYTKETTIDDFQDTVESFLSYLDSKLGTYCVYYVEENIIESFKKGMV